MPWPEELAQADIDDDYVDVCEGTSTRHLQQTQYKEKPLNKHSNPKIREPFTTRGCMIVIVETYITEAGARMQCWNLQNRSKGENRKASKKI